MSSRYTKHSKGDPSQYSFHQSLERRGSIHQSEGHHPEFVESSLRNEGRFLPVCGIHLHLPVSASQVEATEKHRATKRVKAVLNVRERVSVYLHDLVESSVVDTKPGRSILFLHQDGRTAPRSVALLDNADGQHVLNQLLFLLSARCGVASDSLLNGGLITRVDLMLNDISASKVLLQISVCVLPWLPATAGIPH